MTKSKIIINILGVFVAGFIFMASLMLDLIKENFSFFSYEIKGYFLLLFIGISLGFFLAYVAYCIKYKYHYLLFLFTFLGVIVPSEVNQASLLASMHVFISYLAFILLTFILINELIYFRSMYYKVGDITIKSFIILIGICFMIILNFMCVNTLSEITYLLGAIIINLFIYNYYEYKKTI